jgi:hypothetical protein
MRNIDWPLAITLAVVFVVMSIVRWRYFRSLARRRARRAEESARAERADPPAP